MKPRRWIACLLLAASAMLLSAWPVAAQGGNTSAIFNRDYTLAENETLNQDLVVLGGAVRLERASHVQGNVVVAGGSAYIDGLVDGDVVVVGGGAELGAEAVVQGDLVVFGQLSRSSTSRVLGNTVEGLAAAQGLKYLPRMLNALPGVSRLEGTVPVDTTDNVGSLLGSLLGLSLMLLGTLLVVALIPDHLERTAQAMRHSSLLCLGVGVLTLILSGLLTLLLTVICVGIPVALILLLALLLAGLVGWAGAGQIVGTWLLGLLKVKASRLGETLAGVALLGILSNVYGLGGLLAFLVLCWGIGAVVLTRFGALAYPPTPVAPVDTAPGAAPVPPSTPAARRDTKPLDPALIERDLGKDDR